MTYRVKVLMYAFKQYLSQIYMDAMLIILCLAPVLCGIFFHFGIPAIQNILIKYLSMPNVLPPYYLLLDLMLGSLTPLLYCFAAAYVILGEIDEGISKYFAVTPIGKKGYLISRIGFPTLIAFVVSIVTLLVFNLSNLSFLNIIIVAFMTAQLGLVEALLVVSISSNKVEGMAVSKLSGLFIIGLPVPFFLSGNIQYVLFFLPSFWVAKFALVRQPLYILAGTITSIGWLIILYKIFKRKIWKLSLFGLS